ncbi:SRPBCC family protein [Streptomyces phyllanthi]|uniref:SRPBCC family protein n=1 Tax=Streptomyces phyllanthi TaxID=1803180 RepID=A0A5N8W9X6_9ACTN|nr:SRPBCC family protein [Streptomyces phyllanthi]MPY43238.1 SRPBCC family protein [Streptomyces phyllanthi]
MLTVVVTETFPCTPDELLDFVMDVERYALVDRRIRPVRWARRDGDLLEFAFRPRLAGIPGPGTVARVRLTPGRRIDVALAPPPANRLTRLASDFDASFVCTPVEGGTELVRTLNFRFRPPLRWLAEPLLRRPLTAEAEEEIRLAKEYIQRQKQT